MLDPVRRKETVLPDPMIERAVAYPYPRPRGSYLYDASRDRVVPLDIDALDALDRLDDLLAGRHPLLAVGSNAAPRQLARKFADHTGEQTIPVLNVALRDHDAVFAARVSAYGAIPATLAPSDGTVVNVKLTMLTVDQRERMDETEGVGHGYRVDHLEASSLRVDEELSRALSLGAGPIPCYAAAAGRLEVSGSPVALAAVPATGRRWSEMTEADVLSASANALGMELESFVRAVVTDHQFREELNARWLTGGAELDGGAASALQK